jgi:hypothetical protein
MDCNFLSLAGFSLALQPRGGHLHHCLLLGSLHTLPFTNLVPGATAPHTLAIVQLAKRDAWIFYFFAHQFRPGA